LSGDDLPIASHHRGVAIFANQPPKRISRVKKEIDQVGAIADLMRLAEIAEDVAWSPEARLLAGAKCVAGLRRSTERRESKPDIDPERVTATTAGLSSAKWTHPSRYCSLLDPDHERAAPREAPLDDEA
jgi:hypothetical protein